MINFDYIAKENVKEHNPNWSKIPDNPHKITMIGDSRSGKAMHF